VILRGGDYDRWLEPEASTPEVLQTLLRPYPDDDLVLTEVSTRVNNARNDGPECAAPLGAGPEPGMLF
jgi:putative SOS response-associated peptidase YedK